MLFLGNRSAPAPVLHNRARTTSGSLPWSSLRGTTMRMLIEIVRQSLATLWAHKLRSFLTMFGIAWGVGSLLLLVGLGEGFRSGNKKQFNELGENVLFIWGGRAPAMNGSFTSLRQYYLTYEDYLDIRKD